MLDGPTLLADAIRAGIAVEHVFLDPDATGRPEVDAAVRAAVTAGASAWNVTGGLRGHVDVATPNGVAAVGRIPVTDDGDDAACGSPALHVVLVGVTDPGNTGTLLRTAEAVGATSVVLTEGSVDPWSPKVVRASAGSVLRVAVRSEPAGAILGRLGEAGVLRVGTTGTGGRAPDRIDLTGPVAVVLGSEAHGLPADIAGDIDEWASLPMSGEVESLNVAVAGSVLAFEALRQRAATEPASSDGPR